MSKDKELVVLTHNDLDAVGCYLNIEARFPETPKKYFITNYANINEVVGTIVQYKQEHGNRFLLIPDVSFATNKDALLTLYDAFESVTVIDHHMYPDGFWDEFPEMMVVWDTEKSATLLCNEHLGVSGQNKNLDKLSHLIDVYDTWQVDSPYFGIAQDLNDYFWETTDYNLPLTLGDQIIAAGHKLPPDYKQVVEGLHETQASEIQAYWDRKLIYRAQEVTIAFVHRWFNQIQLKEMREGQAIVIGVTPTGIIKVRIRKTSNISTEHKNRLRQELTGEGDIGHEDAFTYKVPGPTSFENTMREVQRIINVIEEITL